ncbi:uncharacterized protein LOC120371889 isoform X4 [Mauremys reevesii]|uniref:uncharacterized protein LOC120371889 isoform X4 n=1 Tax=Mauremys reevesii TaxID=260615 RepID=UPI00193FBECC|nr:uncharacterized protein LOC120371889 isoform X4 [Mauremys reevesii]
MERSGAQLLVCFLLTVLIWVREIPAVSITHVTEPLSQPELRSNSSLVGSTIEFVCKVPVGKVDSYRWKKDGKRLPEDSRFLLFQNDSILCILNTALSDNGVYTCEVSNQVSWNETSLKLDIQTGTSHLCKAPSPTTGRSPEFSAPSLGQRECCKQEPARRGFQEVLDNWGNISTTSNATRTTANPFIMAYSGLLPCTQWPVTVPYIGFPCLGSVVTVGIWLYGLEKYITNLHLNPVYALSAGEHVLQNLQEETSVYFICSYSNGAPEGLCSVSQQACFVRSWAIVSPSPTSS